MLSVKKLSETLLNLYGMPKFTTGDLRRSNVRGISDETYGRDSFVYIGVEAALNGKVTTLELKRALNRAGFKVTNYDTINAGRLEVKVSFFKGCNWNV